MLPANRVTRWGMQWKGNAAQRKATKLRRKELLCKPTMACRLGNPLLLFLMYLYICNRKTRAQRAALETSFTNALTLQNTSCSSTLVAKWTPVPPMRTWAWVPAAPSWATRRFTLQHAQRTSSQLIRPQNKAGQLFGLTFAPLQPYWFQTFQSDSSAYGVAATGRRGATGTWPRFAALSVRTCPSARLFAGCQESALNTWLSGHRLLHLLHYLHSLIFKAFRLH